MSKPTGATYEIRTVLDFLKVPESRRGVCLREFRAFLVMAHHGKALLDALTDDVAPNSGVQVASLDVYRWVDDGKRTVTINVTVKPDTPVASRDKP